MNQDFIKPKADNLHKSTSGQGFNHDLPVNRDWDKALDAIHYLLLKKWYYISIASNTKKGFFGSNVKKEVFIKRKRKNLPDELKSILKMKLSTFEDLKGKIRHKQIQSGGNKDIWHFQDNWKEFPKGTKVIEIHQKLLKNLITNDQKLRKAYVVLDGKCNVSEQNTAMMLINRVLESKSYTASTLSNISSIKSEISKNPAAAKRIEPTLKKTVGKIDVTRTKMPGELIVMIKEDKKILSSITFAEKELLLNYLSKLKETGQYSKTHQNIEALIKIQFKKKD
ncbi:MAG: hypothetical protein OEY59_07680 [Deltaproteobacteria bacterium]|nr:hypothetical protein [Deltaproteobacteria bacterium]